MPEAGLYEPMSDARTISPGEPRTQRPILPPRLSRVRAGSLPPETVIGDRYRVLAELLPRGGEADVYECVEDRTGRRLAVKVYRAEVAPKREVLEKLAGVRHPDVIRLLWFGSWEGRFYEAMELARGGSLAVHAPLEEEHLLDVVLPQVTGGLEHIHSRGVIHRDVKPTNIFYADDALTDVVLGDFGISSLIEGEATLHRTRAFGGTDVFTAPEAYSGIFGREVDYYSLGMTLLMLLTGANPFEGMSPEEMMFTHLQREIPPPSGAGCRAADIIRGLLVKDRKKRWGAAEIRDRLAGMPVPLAEERPPAAEQVNGRFSYKLGEGLVANDLKELGRLLFEHRETGRKHLGQGILIHRINQYDQALASRLHEIRESSRSLDAALVEIMYLFNPAMPYRLLRENGGAE